MVYKYYTLEEAQLALEQVNTYFGLPCGDTLNWTDIQEENEYWFLEADRLDEIL